MPLYINKQGITRYIVHGIYLNKAEMDAVHKEAQANRRSDQAQIAFIIQEWIHAQDKGNNKRD